MEGEQNIVLCMVGKVKWIPGAVSYNPVTFWLK